MADDGADLKEEQVQENGKSEQGNEIEETQETEMTPEVQDPFLGGDQKGGEAPIHTLLSSASPPIIATPSRIDIVKASLKRVKKMIQKETDNVPASFWVKEFEALFLQGWDDRDDDMMYYVHDAPVSPKHTKNSKPFTAYRIGSADSPAMGDKTVDWEQSYYLNIVLHCFEYSLTITVDTQVLKRPTTVKTKIVDKVWASPSKTQMEQAKGAISEISYPDIFFSIHTFFDLFDNVVCKQGDRVCVEIVASLGELHVAIFQGSVLFEKLLEVYLSKQSSQWTAYLPAALRSQNIQFLDMKGPRGKGRAQMAIRKVKSQDGNTQQKNESGMFEEMGKWFVSVVDSMGGSGSSSPSSNSGKSDTKLNACLAFVSIHINFIMADFLGKSYREPSLARTCIEKDE